MALLKFNFTRTMETPFSHTCKDSRAHNCKQRRKVILTGALTHNDDCCKQRYSNCCNLQI